MRSFKDIRKEKEKLYLLNIPHCLYDSSTNCSHLLSMYHGPSTKLSTLLVSFHLILTAMLRQIQMGKLRLSKFRNSLMVTPLIKAGI